MDPERLTLILGSEKILLPRSDVEQIQAHLVEQPLLTRELRDLLAEALATGRGRIDEAHRMELLSVLEAMHSRELRRLWEVAQDRILSTDR